VPAADAQERRARRSFTLKKHVVLSVHLATKGAWIFFARTRGT